MGTKASLSTQTGSEFGLPARRRRLYVFLVRVEANPLLSFQDRSVDSIFSAFGGLLFWMCEARALCFRSSFGWRWPCGARWLNPSDAATRRAQSTWKAFEHRVGRSPHEDGQNLCGWGVGQGAQPNVSNNSWYKTLTDREQDALPLLQVQSPGSLMRALSQSINHANAFTWKAEAGKHIAPTMLPKMNLWLEPVPPRNAARLMLGREALLFQGFPALLFLERLDTFQAQAEASGLVAQAAQPSNTKPLVKRAKHPHQVNERIDFRKQDLLLTWRPTETLMQDLAGNAMSLPVVMTMLQCAFVAVNWQSAGEVRRAADAPATTQQDWHAISTTL